MRDLPDAAALLALGREYLLDTVLARLPADMHRDLRLVATVMAMAARELDAGEIPADLVSAELARFYEASESELDTGGTAGKCAGARPLIPTLSPDGRRGEKRRLARLAADLRIGAFETCEQRERAARAILWRLTIGKLRVANPQFLAANGFGE
ncbi:MAG TPA: DUF6285 domain-containing protein [Stellaceae bacterium]|jgi:hypothetical protein|nr:DUF6285 domain-containing protein [Stellaceae bacterium]